MRIVWTVFLLLSVAIAAPTKLKRDTKTGSSSKVLYSSWNSTLEDWNRDDYLEGLIHISNSSTTIFLNESHVMVNTDLSKPWVTLFEDWTYIDSSVSVDKTFNNIVYIIAEKKTFISYDYGMNWKDITREFPNITFVNGLEVNPSNSSVLLLQVHLKESQSSEVFISYDKGDSFEPMHIGDQSSVNCTCWYTGNSGSDIQCVTLVSYFNEDFKDVYYSKDLGKSFQKVAGLEGINSTFSGAPYDSYLLVQPSKLLDNTDLVWYRSKNGGEFKKLYLNNSNGYFEEILGGRLIYSQYSETSKNHKLDSPTFYISDSDGVKFTVLQHSYNGSLGSINLASSLPGTIFITSLLTTSGFTNISTDNGITWSNPRIVDADKAAGNYTCDINSSNCTFVLTKVLEDYPTGIIIATGHESFWDTRFVDTEDDSTEIVSSFSVDMSKSYHDDVDDFIAISNDGGYTWRKLADSSTKFYTSNYGNTIIIPSYNDESGYAKINITFDQGITWQSAKLSIPVNNIIDASMDQVSNKFYLLGLKELHQTYLFTMDLTDSYNIKHCDPSTDLIKFSANKGGCINGARYTSFTKKDSVNCILDESYTKLNITACDRCTINDYICAPEFTENSKVICVPDVTFMNSQGGSCVNNSTKLPSMVLIQDNKCKKRFTMPSIPISC
ncbi:hypothetical protein RNJ44_01429 [Nakaseomyces bracarensis]|uniref:VPS10 domain-containing protein n=1 Tax=Nakaseomyces bracarensis TaxID=273131 RepID=A0ABR4NPX4_9SACH